MLDDYLRLPGPDARSLALKVVGYAVSLGLALFMYRLYQVRMMVRRAMAQPGVYALPHSFLFGHLITIAKVAIKNKTPRGAHGQLVPLLLAREYPEVMKAGIVYMDVWPISPPMISVFHPDLIAQFTQHHSLEKHPGLAKTFRGFTGGTDLVVTEGEEWKNGRAIFNPGFSSRNLLSLIPSFVEDALVFRDILNKASETEEIITLVKYTTNLTIDIISRAVLGTTVEAQRKPVKFMKAMLDQIKLVTFELDIKKSLNPLSPYRNWVYNRIFREEMMPFVQDTIQNYEKIEGPKTVLTLAVKAYVDEIQDVSDRGNIPPEFSDRVINHVKMFLFAGHDTTATTLAYAYYELNKNPKKLAILRAEHDKVLGPDPSKASERIAANPNLLNELPYTLASIRETLRLWPVVGTIRIGSKGFYLHHPETGVRYDAEGFMVFATSASLHRNPNFWPEPESFIPERFLTRDETDPLHPVKNSFRPWELGPRNCIGQELASLELRLILALTIRDFDIELAYSEDSPTYLGTKAYQEQVADTITAHPKDGMPVRVRRRK